MVRHVPDADDWRGSHALEEATPEEPAPHNTEDGPPIREFALSYTPMMIQFNERLRDIIDLSERELRDAPIYRALFQIQRVNRVTIQAHGKDLQQPLQDEINYHISQLMKRDPYGPETIGAIW